MRYLEYLLGNIAEHASDRGEECQLSHHGRKVGRRRLKRRRHVGQGFWRADAGRSAAIGWRRVIVDLVDILSVEVLPSFAHLDHSLEGPLALC